MNSQLSSLNVLPLSVPSTSLSSLYATHGHLFVEGIPPRSLLTLDGVSMSICSSNVNTSAHANDKPFKGFKLIPPGWHSLTIRSSGSAATETIDDILALRSCFLFHVHARQVITRQWDINASTLLSATDSHSAGSSHVLTAGTMASIDTELTPYPLRAEQYAEWIAFARPFDKDSDLTERVIEKMLGFSSTAESLEPVSGGALEDQLRRRRRPGPSDAEKKLEESLLQASAKRPERESISGVIDVETATGQKDQNPLSVTDVKKIRLAEFSLLRSWPEGAIASDRTRWSQDKSRALFDAIESLSRLMSRFQEEISHIRMQEARQALLLSFHLVFHLFQSLGSEDLLKAWGNYISLVCQAASAVGSNAGAFEAHPSEVESTADLKASGSSDDNQTFLQPGLHSGFLHLLALQLRLLDKNWFAEAGGEEMQVSLQSDLKMLRGNMGRAMALDARRRERDAQIKHPSNWSNQIETDEDEAPIIIRSSKSPGARGGRQQRTTQLSSSISSSSSTIPRSASSLHSVASPPSLQDFESLLTSWRSLSVLVTSKFQWTLDEQTDEEAEVMEEMDEEYQEAVRRALEEMPQEAA